MGNHTAIARILSLLHPSREFPNSCAPGPMTFVPKSGPCGPGRTPIRTVNLRASEEVNVLIVGIIESCVTALICGFIALRASHDTQAVALRWVRIGLFVLGLGAAGDAVSQIVTNSQLPFAATVTEALLWSLLSTIGVGLYLRHRRRPSFWVRLTTAFAALSSSFGFVWLIALGFVVQDADMSTFDRVASSVMMSGVVVQLAMIVVTLKRTEYGALPGFTAFAGGSLTVSFAHAAASFDQLGIISVPQGLVELFILIGVTGVGISIRIAVNRRPNRASRLSIASFFYAPALVAIVLSIGRYADTTDEYVFGFTSLILFGMLIGQTAGYRSSARRTQAALERRVAQRTYELEQAGLVTSRAVEFTADGIIALDLDQSILFMNPASRRILTDADTMLNMIRARLEQGERAFDLTDGSTTPTRTIRVIGTRLGFSNVSWILTLRDVTEEEGLILLKTRMLTAVSHEIRTPLTSLHGSLALLDSGVVDDLPADAVQLLSIARTSSDRLLRLVNEYLNFERLNTRRPEPIQLQTDDLRLVVEEVVHLMKPLASTHMIRLVHEVESIPLPMVRDQIVQILSNLVHNAIKFSPPDCIINIEATQCDDSVVVSVLDRGQGLRANEVERIFEPFYTSSLTESSGGTGMGLAICRSIVAKHGGQIWAEIRDGGGAVFRFTLPVGEASTIQRLAS